MENDMLQAVWPEWKIVRRISRGSYGVVYKAVRTDHAVESFAAIKVISIPENEAELDTLRSTGLTEEASRTYLQEVVDDFVNEIRIMESFKGSQNIVSVEDYKVVEKKDKIGWDIYIRMELLTPLVEYIDGKTLSEKEVIQIGCDICSALERCALRNVIHRDIKPGNILVNTFGDFKLGDFGVARTLENVTSGLSQKGTPNYMAPEVEKGNRYDATVDIYSLGLVLYWLMNKKRLPFVSTEKQLLSPRDVATANRRRLDGEALPAPCEASPEMAEVILKACDPDPARRFASAKEMKEALKKVEDGTYQTQNAGIHASEETIGARHGAPQRDPGDTVNVRSAPDSGAYAVEEIRTFGERKKKPTVQYVLIALLAVLLIGGGAFAISKGFGNKSSEETETSEEVQTAEETETAEEVPSAEETVSAEESQGSEEAGAVALEETQGEEEASNGSVRVSASDVVSPDGPFFTYDGHTYCFYDVNTINESIYGNVRDADAGAYKNVQQFCREQGGHLAIINSVEENQVLFEQTQERYDYTVFFGLSDQNREGRWVWDDGSEDTLGLWAYKSGVQQPDNGNGYSVENYAEFDYDRYNPQGSDNTGMWNDAAYLKNTSIFICEWDFILEGLE